VGIRTFQGGGVFAEGEEGGGESTVWQAYVWRTRWEGESTTSGGLVFRFGETPSTGRRKREDRVDLLGLAERV